MNTLSQNPYLLARIKANMTRQKAAMLLSASETSVKEYEKERTVPDDIVLRMAVLYNAPWLKAVHLSRNLVFRDVFGEVSRLPALNPAINVLMIQKSIGRINREMPQIIESTLTCSTDKRILEACVECMNALFIFITNKKVLEAAPSRTMCKNQWE